MDVFERVQREVPGARGLRMRNEHAQILDPADIPRFKALDVIASMQATHATSDMPWVATRIGPERTAAGAYVWQKLLKSGAVLADGVPTSRSRNRTRCWAWNVGDAPGSRRASPLAAGCPTSG